MTIRKVRVRVREYAEPVNHTMIPKVRKSLTTPIHRTYDSTFKCAVCKREYQFNTRYPTYRDEAIQKLKRHYREKHRNYWTLAQAKPFVIHEEEEAINA